MRPVTVEIVAYAPTEFFHCLHCELVWNQTGMGSKIHAEQRISSLPPDLAAQYERLAEWACSISERFGDAVELHVTDATSPVGFFKALRHGLWRLPAIVVSGRGAFGSQNLEAAENAIASQHAALVEAAAR